MPPALAADLQPTSLLPGLPLYGLEEGSALVREWGRLQGCPCSLQPWAILSLARPSPALQPFLQAPPLGQELLSGFQIRNKRCFRGSAQSSLLWI